MFITNLKFEHNSLWVKKSELKMKVTIVIYVFFFNIKNTFKLKYKNGNKSLLNKLTCGSVVSHITVLPGVGK